MGKDEALEKSISLVISSLGSATSGLTAEEAKRRLAKYGPNTLAKGRPSAIAIFVKQFTSSLIYLLILAAVLSFFLKDFSGGAIISIIIIINAALGFFQEYRSERAVEKLSKLISRQTLVVRNDKTELINENFLVPGDIVILRPGDIVPADIKIIEASDFSVNESQLTGESLPVAKSAKGQGLPSLLFAGSVIEKGDAKGVVYATGNATELGKIATLSRTTKRETPYERSLKDFSNYLLRIILITLALVFAAKVFISQDTVHITSLFLFIVALAFTVIPEALPVIATATLSEGALRLARKHVVVKRLSSLDDLGHVTLLCTDKTGTLTENKLSVLKVVSSNEVLFQKFAYATTEDLGVKKKKFQNSFDAAFMNFVPQNIKDQVKDWKQLKDLPFDPEARRRRVVVEDTGKRECYLVEIGSAETLLGVSECEKKKQYLAAIRKEGQQGIRHLGIAYKKITYTSGFDMLKHEDNLLFLGYAELVDSLRPTAKDTVALAEKLGIKIKILTGDSPEVAAFVGQRVGLLTKNGKVYTGEELQSMPAEQQKTALEEGHVFARVTPELKYNIIKELKSADVVGYQGDGINDAPSLKLADVAIAVNNATDVAKESADIVLLRNDIEVIINGIRYGRSIFVNINKYIKHTMVGNLGNFFSLALLYLISVDLPMLPIQLLLANLVQDIPLITIYSDNVDINEIKKPQLSNVSAVMLVSLFLGTFSALYDFIYMTFVGFRTTPSTQTNLFLFFTLTQLLVILSVRNKGHLWRGKGPSFLVLVSIAFFFVLALGLTYVPLLAKLFSFTSLPTSKLVTLFAVTIIYILSLDYIKVWYYKIIRKYVP